MQHKPKPFYTTIIEKTHLNPGSSKKTFHLSLDLEGKGVSFKPGDCIGIHPLNPYKLVARTLDALKLAAETKLSHRKHGELSAFALLRTKANLSQITKPVAKAYAAAQTNPQKKQELETLIAPENREQFHHFATSQELWDFAQYHHEVVLDAATWTKLLPPLMPRYYSIASSLAHTNDQVDLLIALSAFEVAGIKRAGICTHYLLEEAIPHQTEIEAYVQPTGEFLLPEDPKAPILMIGPGTGVAPFRSFLQQREAEQAKGKNWLIFGERTRQHDFYYQEEFNQWVNQGFLELDTAFSRDQADKVYVQDRLWQQKAKVFEWVQEGGYIYLCGDAKAMAPAVDQTLEKILEVEGQMSAEQAAHTLHQLREERRYLKDVY